MSLAPSSKLTNLGNKFTVNSFLPYLRLTVKMFQFLRLSTKFLAVVRLSVNPIKTLLDYDKFEQQQKTVFIFGYPLMHFQQIVIQFG